MAVCVAVIGKENSPLFVSCANPDQVKGKRQTYVYQKKVLCSCTKLSDLTYCLLVIKDAFEVLKNYRLFRCWALGYILQFVMIKKNLPSKLEHKHINYSGALVPLQPPHKSRCNWRKACECIYQRQRTQGFISWIPVLHGTPASLRLCH